MAIRNYCAKIRAVDVWLAISCSMDIMTASIQMMSNAIYIILGFYRRRPSQLLGFSAS